ncbi:MAG: thioredoxin-disulfide reductase [Blastocatellia bacterium]
MSSAPVEKVIILGSGPAGLTAAIYAGRADLSPVLIHGSVPGGQLTITTDVENYPGFPDGIMGPELMEAMEKQAARFGTRFHRSFVTNVDLSKRPFTLTDSEGQSYLCDALIISTGAEARWIGIESEQHLNGYGVSACATCDGPLPAFRNQHIAVIGGGDTAMEEANFLAKFGSKVTVVHRRDALRASKIMQQKAFDNPKIDFAWDSAVDEIIGSREGGVTGLRLKNLKTGELTTHDDIRGVFVAIGHKPNTELFAGQLEMDENRYLVTKPGTTQTSIAGVFAAGDVQDHVYRQAVTAAGTGCMAAIEAERFLESAG